MKDEEIRKYAQIMQQFGLNRLSVNEKGSEVCLERTAAAPAAGTTAAAAPAAPAAPVEAEENADYISIKSPMVGVFYAAPAENADPFVSVGDRVEEGATLCIIEAMKLMNEIRADKAGVVSKICVTNGQVVEFGTELFRLTR